MPRPSPQTERLVTLFNLLAADPGAGLTVAEIARRLGINKATCYPMLAALQDAGYLVRHPVRRTFHLGPALVPVGRAAAVGFPAPDLVRAALVGLSTELGLTVVAIARAEDHLVVLDQAFTPRHPARALGVGQRLPLRPPWGAVFVAWGDGADRDRWLASGPDDPDGAARWQATLAGVRALGGAVEVNELPPEQVQAQAESLRADATRAELQAFVERLVGELSAQRDPVRTHIDPARDYPVSSVNVPVAPHAGRVVLALAAMGFPGPVSGADILGVLGRLQQAAAALPALPELA